MTTKKKSNNPKYIKLEIDQKDLDNLKREVKKLILEAEDVELLARDPNLSDEVKGLFAFLLNETLIEKARVDFYTFARLLFRDASGEDFVDGRHLRILCKKLMELESGKISRLMIFISPRSGKSWLTKLFVAWCFGRKPNLKSIAVSANTTLAEDNYGRPVKDILNLDLYKKVFPGTAIREDAQAVGRWQTNRSGTFFVAGAGSQIVGRGADLAICDDVLSEVTAESDNEVEKINNWYGPGLRSRLMPKAKELIINTRWRTDDLAGYLLDNAVKSTNKRHKWDVISIPAILDKQSSELLGLPEGGSYWPEFWALEDLLEKRDDPSMSPSQWNAIYMQNPVPREGNLIKTEWCKIWTDDEAYKLGLTKDITPELQYVIISLDTAFSEKETADYSAYSVWGVFKRKETLTNGTKIEVPCMMLLEHNKGRWSFPDLCQRVQELKDNWNPDGMIIEKKASGISLIQEMRRRGLPIIEYVPDKDKISRVHACTALFESGRIWFPDRAQSYELIGELTKFPNIPKKDLVDTVSQAVLWMRDTWHINSVLEIDEDEDFVKQEPKTYWQAIAGPMQKD